jgi:hypothetical protein
MENSEQTFEDVVEASYSLRFYIPHSSTMCAAQLVPFGRTCRDKSSYYGLFLPVSEG